MLLAGEDEFDLAAHTRELSEQPPRLLRARGSETGSLFHEGGVWPPPGASSRLADPLMSASDVNVASIVDRVMGPSLHGPGPSRLRGGEASESLLGEGDSSDEHAQDDSFYRDHELSADSQQALLPDLGLSAGAAHGPYRHSPPASDGDGAPGATTGMQKSRNWIDRSPNMKTREARLSLAVPLEPAEASFWQEDEPALPDSSVLDPRSASASVIGMPWSRSTPPPLPGQHEQLVDVSTGNLARRLDEIPPRYDMLRRDTAETDDSIGTAS